MKSIKYIILGVVTAGALYSLYAMKAASVDVNPTQPAQAKVMPGADMTQNYLPYLRGKRFAMLVNASSRIGDKVSVDSLVSLNVKPVKIFSPEHGFRDYVQGTVADKIDPPTGIPIVSLYGAKRKPTKEDLEGVDLVVFDLQDVGVRFYTYISTLHLIMEACAENNVELMILDRPNPNGYYVDGPVKGPDMPATFVSMHPTPTIHGMTVGEYAQMINGEGWLPNKMQTKLRVVKIANWTHDTPYTLPVRPSPALMTQQSVLLYPSLCLFEGTTVSQGRNSDYSFEALGSADLEGKYSFYFTTARAPEVKLYGINLKNYDTNIFRRTKQINIAWVLELYNAYPDKTKFFRGTTINTRLGSSNFINQITSGMSEADIRKSWEPGLSQYKEMRKKYMLYP